MNRSINSHDAESPIIQSPHGIRFECSGCANCCLQWPVPLTASDYDKLQAVSAGAGSTAGSSDSSSFGSGTGSNASSSVGSTASTRPLRSSRNNLHNFTHTLEKQADGTCEFLMVDKRCKLHAGFGVESKPSMCRLFPYSFTVTPDAVLATVSFASSAVLFNTGKLLSEQPEVLVTQYKIFRNLFDINTELWNKLQVIDGQVINWEQFKLIDKDLSELMLADGDAADQLPQQVGKKLKQMSQRVLAELRNASLAEREPKLESRPKIVDQILLKHLERLYFPEQVFAEEKYDLDARELMVEMVGAPQVVSFGQAGQELKFSELIKLNLGKLPAEVDDLINRFLYTRFFSKMYFGPGFHHLSLLAGLHHLQILHTLLRLKIKQALVLKRESNVSFEFVCELIRTMERRLTQLDFSAQSLAMLEVLMSSPLRQQRLPGLAE